MSDKLKKEIFNGVGENVRALAQLFPSAVKDGEVDFAALKQELGEFVEVGAEKYDFTWAGKAKAKAEAVTDIPGRTLKYVKGDGVNEDTTGNLYIEGDNLEALKLLRNSYYNKIKMIYIDPPYNTGNDFVYKDNFAMTEEEKLAMAEAGEEVDEYGERLVKNNSDNSKYHTNWLNMIYPRLKIARDLLTDDGVIFISIDDNEVHNMRKICDEVFGVDNFIAEFPRVTKKGGKSTDTYAKNHDYVLVFAKSIATTRINGIAHIDDGFKNKDEFYDTRGAYKLNQTLDYNTLQYNTTMDFAIEIDGKVFVPGGDLEKQKQRHLGVHGKHDWVWRWSKALFDFGYKNGWIEISSTGRIYTKTYLNATINKNATGTYYIDFMERTKPLSTLDFIENVYSNDNSNKEISAIMGTALFDYVKPTSLVKQIMMTCTKKDSLILDFFSGSATTAHAVMQLNAEDGGNRKFICVQVPELCDEKSEAYKAGYKNICEIGKERIRRAGKKIKADRNIKIGVDKSKLMQRTLLDDGTFEDKYDIKVTHCLDDDILDNLDIGFKVFKVADTNIRMFSNELNNVELLGQVDIKDIDPEQIDFNNGATDLDVCYELLLRHRGIPLSSKVGKLPIGERTYAIADSIVVCLDKQVAESLVEQLAAIDPLPNKYIFRDSSFGDDISLKENTMIHLQAIIEKNSGASKKTYTVEFI